MKNRSLSARRFTWQLWHFKEIERKYVNDFALLKRVILFCESIKHLAVFLLLPNKANKSGILISFEEKQPNLFSIAYLQNRTLIIVLLFK